MAGERGTGRDARLVGDDGRRAGDIRFGENNSEWAEARVLQIQFRHVTGGDLEQFKKPATPVIVAPSKYVSGKVLYPFTEARK